MDLEQLRKDVSLLEQALATRVEVSRVVVGVDGKEVRRIFRGTFHAPPDWQPPLNLTLAKRSYTND
jgi:hypothetical protein